MWVIFSKYIIVGIANTLLTLSIIFTLMYCGISLYYANAMGYGAGILLSFILNSLFTFSTNISGKKLVKFLISCLICYLINLGVIKLFLTLFPEMKYLAQLLGMGFYTVSGFIINKMWAMK